MQNEVEIREKAALAAIKELAETQSAESTVSLFIEHHLEELDSTYWLKHLNSEKPKYAEILNLLVLREHWAENDDDGVDAFDFTLPDDVTDYVICVRFDASGQVTDITMES